MNSWQHSGLGNIRHMVHETARRYCSVIVLDHLSSEISNIEIPVVSVRYLGQIFMDLTYCDQKSIDICKSYEGKFV